MCRLLLFLFYFCTIQQFPFLFFFFFFPILKCFFIIRACGDIYFLLWEQPFFCYKQCLHSKVRQPQLYQFYPRQVFLSILILSFILSITPIGYFLVGYPSFFATNIFIVMFLNLNCHNFFPGPFSSFLYMRINLFYRIGYNPQLPMGNMTWCCLV